MSKMREVPIPPLLAQELSGLLAARQPSMDAPTDCPNYIWQNDGKRINRITGYRWIKAVMAKAGIKGAQASPKGLRHGYGIHALRSGVQQNMLQKWMGHASMCKASTTLSGTRC